MDKKKIIIKIGICLFLYIIIFAFIWGLIALLVMFADIGLLKIKVSEREYFKVLLEHKVVLFSLGISSFVWIGLLIVMQIRRKYFFGDKNNNKLYGNARWLTKSEFNKKTEKSIYNKIYKWGWVVNTQINRKKEPTFNILQKRHSISIGTSGNGKTQTNIYANIFNNLNATEKPSMIITDPKGEIYKKWYKYAHLKKYNVIHLDFEHFKGHKWNPIAPAQKLWQEKKYSESLKLITELNNSIWNTQDERTGKKDFWDKSGMILISAIIIALFIEKEKSNDWKYPVNFKTIGDKISQPDIKIIDWLNDYKENSYLRSKIGAYLYKNNRVFVSIQMSASTAFDSIKDDAFNKMCYINEINMKNIVKKPTIIFLRTAIANTSFWFLNQLFITNLMSYLLDSKNANNNQRPLLFLFDEFKNIPIIPDFDNILSNSRTYNIWFNIILQSIPQMKKYKEYENIISNCHLKMYLQTDNEYTTKWFSQLCGNKTIEQKNYHYNTKNEQSYSITKQEKCLIDYDELRRLKDWEQLVILPKSFPYKHKSIPFYKYDDKINI